MTQARAIAHGPIRCIPIASLHPGDTTISRGTDGQATSHQVTGINQQEVPTVMVKMRGRNSLVAAGQGLMRIIPPKHGRKFPVNCDEDRCPRIAEVRGLCGPCYRRRWAEGSLPDAWTVPPRYATELVPSSQIERGNLVVVLDRQPDLAPASAILEEDALIRQPVTPKLAWLMGAIIGDGTVAFDIRVAAFGSFAEQVANAIREVFNIEPRAHPKHGLIATGAAATKLLLSLGYWRRGSDKCVPETVWCWPRYLQQEFCAGYAAADGYLDPRPGGGQRYDSCSRRLLDEVRTLHILAGHRVTNVSTNHRRKPITIKGKLVRHAKPLHNFVVSSRDCEPYTCISRPIVDGLTGGTFGLRVVLGVEDIGTQEHFTIAVNGADNVVIDGLPIWDSSGGADRGAMFLARPRRPRRRLRD